MDEGMIVRDLFLKRTYRSGRTVVTHHRVWDTELFMNCRQEEASKDSAKNPADAYLVSMATEAEYKATKGARK